MKITEILKVDAVQVYKKSIIDPTQWIYDSHKLVCPKCKSEILVENLNELILCICGLELERIAGSIPMEDKYRCTLEIIKGI